MNKSIDFLRIHSWGRDINLEILFYSYLNIARYNMGDL